MATGDKPVSLEKLANYPTMTSWFRPTLLAKLLWRVIVSELFGQYADRRLIVAALDPVPKEEILSRARQFYPGTTFDNEDDRPPTTFTPDEEGAVWIDFLADLGDGFDSTFAIASLLAREQLKIGDLTLPRGQLLVMGGDEVYPNADPKLYHDQLINPYSWAFPDPKPGLLEGPPVYAIPGNHDWYDGLVLFLAYFTRRSPHLHLGGWRSWQRRSYFALQLTKTWWIWAIDAQLDDDVDQPQKDYFDLIAKSMDQGSKVILCGPEPGWLYTLQQGNKSLSVIDNIAWSAVNAKHKLAIPIVLSGDTHHYSRYSGSDGITQFITSGGGGAFLHPTHQLADTVALDQSTINRSWLGGTITTLKLNTDPSVPHVETDKAACYPSKERSYALLKGNFQFVRMNFGFCALLGAVYWLSSWITIGLYPDSILFVPAVFFLGFWAYTKRQEGNSKKTVTASIGNAIFHSAVAIPVALLFARFNAHLPDFCGFKLPSVLISFLEMGLAGTFIGGYLFGIYLYVSSKYFDMNHNDAFSSMRLNTHKNSLRMRITEDEVRIYPIGLTDIPAREDWQMNPSKSAAEPAEYVPRISLQPHLIEGPIVVRLKSETESAAKV